MSKVPAVCRDTRGEDSAITNRLDESMRVLHAAVFTNCQPLARLLQLDFANLRFLAGFQALGGSIMRAGHRPMTLNIGLDFGIGVLPIRY